MAPYPPWTGHSYFRCHVALVVGLISVMGPEDFAGRWVSWGCLCASMQSLYRTLLVLCALPLDEVSCRVQGSNTLFMVACAAVYDPPFAIERHFGPRWHGFCLGLTACRNVTSTPTPPLPGSMTFPQAAEAA